MLYRGAVAEAGDVELVVGQPEHPYTQLLVGSIPLPDPDAPWHGERALERSGADLAPTGTSFCAFHERCPYVMPACVEQAPPLFRTASQRVSACYLYQSAPAIAGERLQEVLGEGLAEKEAQPAQHHQVASSACRC